MIAMPLVICLGSYIPAFMLSDRALSRHAPFLSCLPRSDVI
ncbi:hypothetical protein GXY_16573 [Novacetimonas hansenii ATCC 23769]|uniref:Uncharacterized protein n=1 Tax=Novacetimonas hansenii ATCC 23769 TaxID=714995 RepID=D5QJI0_NOVHA|nr:hypothetical protein GXY_16573 [Novacetimonas hansenii ATCC 23769]